MSGRPMNSRKLATPLYSAGVRFGAVIAHRLAPPMMLLLGDLMISGSYGSTAAAQLNLALRTMSARPDEEPKPIAAWPV